MMRILIADDDRFIRDSLPRILKEENCQIQVVESGSEVIRRLLKQKFNLLFLDIYMGGMDGLETILLIKEIDPHLPIVVITGDSSTQMKSKIQALEVFDFLTKPLNPLKVKNIIKAFSSGQEFNYGHR